MLLVPERVKESSPSKAKTNYEQRFEHICTEIGIFSLIKLQSSIKLEKKKRNLVAVFRFEIHRRESCGRFLFWKHRRGSVA